MRVLLMEVPWYVFFPQATQPDAPLGCSYIAAVLEKAGHDAVIFNPDLKDDAADELGTNDFKNEMDDYKVYLETIKGGSHKIWSEIISLIESFRPEMVGLTVRTPAVGLAYRTAELIKSIDPTIHIVLGGPHPTCCPVEVASHKAVDVVVIGEGEDTILDLISCYEERRALNTVKGIAYTRDERFMRTAPRPLIEDLDSIPFPAKYLILNKERMHSDNFANIFATRGCSYSCTFCSSHNVWTKKIRFRSPGNVLAEMKFMEERYGSEFFSFSDDSFTVNKKWVLELCELIKKTNFGPNFRWVCNTKSNLIDDDIARAFKEAGCAAVALGIESGSDRVLERMKKGTTVEKSRDAVKILKKHNLRFTGQFVIGFPWETEAEILRTIEFMKELDPMSVMMSIATPLPGTELYNEAIKLGLIDPANLDWAKVTTKNDGILFNPEIPKERVKELVALARDEAGAQEAKWAAVRYDYKLIRDMQVSN